MKVRKRLWHLCFVLITLFLILGIPVISNFDIFGQSGGADAVSSASNALPDQPSGDYIVLMKTSLHEDSLKDWDNFFHDRDFDVIFEDINCLTCEGDVNGQQLAERFQAQLPENQMRIKSINAVLLASKAEAGIIDVAIFSSDMADMIGFDQDQPIDGVTIMTVSGGGQ